MNFVNPVMLNVMWFLRYDSLRGKKKLTLFTSSETKVSIGDVLVFNE